MIDITPCFAACTEPRETFHVGAARGLEKMCPMCCSNAPGLTMELAEIWVPEPSWSCQPQGQPLCSDTNSMLACHSATIARQLSTRLTK